MVAIVWFRNDLRLQDNPALLAAALSGDEVIPLYILDEETIKLGSANRWWLHYSLESLSNDIKQMGGKLCLRQGNALEVLKIICEKQDVKAIYWNRRYDFHGCEQDKLIKLYFQNQSVNVQSFNGNFLFDPYVVKNGKGTFFQVFTPFWKHCINAYTPIHQPCEKPKFIKFNQDFCDSQKLPEWNFLPTKPNWAKGFESLWEPGENGAKKRLKNFLKIGLKDYKINRDFPSIEATSKLSPHLRFGEISPRTIWYEVKNKLVDSPNLNEDAFGMLSEIGWREFANYLLFHCPHMPDQPLRKDFLNFPWQENKNDFFKKWQQGETGYPIVDAGMRELWHTGWMHNRVRMIVASFLVKHLLIHWKSGETWFFDTLVDADIASNSMNWQWVAGSGCDAAPYFRIFNPILQGKKFDPNGYYIRHWVPELKDVSNNFIHSPWMAQNRGKYVLPIVNHEEARKKALQAYEVLKIMRAV